MLPLKLQAFRRFLTVISLIGLGFTTVNAQDFDDDLLEPLGDLRSEQFTFVILSQPNTKYHIPQANRLKKDLIRQSFVWKLQNKPQVLSVHEDFPEAHGGWAVWPIINQVNDAAIKYHGNNATFWIVFVKEDTVIRLDILLEVLQVRTPNARIFIGHKLVDRTRTIIHHFAVAEEDVGKKMLSIIVIFTQRQGTDEPLLAYPSFAAGFVLSSTLLKDFAVQLTEHGKGDFTIDPKYELAKKLLEYTDVRLEHDERFCTTIEGEASFDCATRYVNQTQKFCTEKLENDQIAFAVKTYHEHHKTRIVVVKRTWAKYAAIVDYFSDMYDVYIPSIELPIKNTETGHCAKTLAIMRYFYDLLEYADKKWLVIADDDTLLSVSRIVNLLKCFDASQQVIVGERYGYGFTADANTGYDYPTGGAGMAFSRSAVEAILHGCSCPSDNSPDDMIIGMCAVGNSIPVFTSDAMHQARPDDYPVDYLTQEPAVSFHKHWQVDPYQVYADYLTSESDTLIGAHHVAHDADATFQKHHQDGQHLHDENANPELRKFSNDPITDDDEHKEL